ncbi:hypothetical protein LNTAR_21690 [Lentisphaera araneosa HTCC2155]|uniref:Uncharacterized protein n=1 Tax=Lentisphaera araneosa HTCC2155 TaxID=313628 RepID=A6DM72_9BACT|nr:hypothetical protein LNTAR_21690 [Lentisphaera araneosa HTCC2155]
MKPTTQKQWLILGAIFITLPSTVSLSYGLIHKTHMAIHYPNSSNIGVLPFWGTMIYSLFSIWKMTYYSLMKKVESKSSLKKHTRIMWIAPIVTTLAILACIVPDLTFIMNIFFFQEEFKLLAVFCPLTIITIHIHYKFRHYDYEHNK